MIRSLLNSVSTSEVVLILVAGAVLLAVALAVGFRSVIPEGGQRRFEETMDGLRIIFELLFALLLAFVIASVLDRFDTADQTVGEEATALSQMLRENTAFPLPPKRSCGRRWVPTSTRW
ncbi:MAG: hypothetical protein ACR2KV_13605 [Solirubrobacteraceae bacterium]